MRRREGASNSSSSGPLCFMVVRLDSRPRCVPGATLSEMTTSQLIRHCAERVQRPFLVIGGHAVIAHGYPRTTLDLDLLVRKRDREEWLRQLQILGYEPAHLHEVFAQLTSSGGVDLDLMFANDPTFEAMFADAAQAHFGEVSARVPSLEHLVALKLHVLKQGLRHRTIGDLDDIIRLVLANQVDVGAQKWQQLFEKHGNLELYEKVRDATRS